MRRSLNDVTKGLVQRGTIAVPSGILVISAAVQLPGLLLDFAKVAEQNVQTIGLSHADRTRPWSSAPLTLNTQAWLAAV